MKMIELLNKAQDEILLLRRQNEILSAKVEVLELFACVLHTAPAVRREEGQALDVAWQLQTQIDLIKGGLS